MSTAAQLDAFRPGAKSKNGNTAMNREEIETTIKDILVEDFEVDAAKLTPDVDLFADLDLDSIDAVDLVVRLQQEVKRKVDPAQFRKIRKLSDVVDAVEALLAQG